MKKPYISVVIPAYNEEKLIERCLRSVLNQDFPKDRYEVIVVDNNSTDKTVEIAEKFDVKLIKERMKGAAFARQTGAMTAKGEIIISFDADSTAPKNWLKRIDSDFESNPAAIAVAGFYRVKRDYSVSRFYLKFLILLSSAYHYFKKQPLWISAANFAFKKSAFKKIGGYPTKTGRSADQVFFLNRLKKLGDILFDPELIILTSNRRIKGRFLKSLMLDGLIYVYLDPLVRTLIGKPLPGKAEDIR